jgi:hypothetical protein
MQRALTRMSRNEAHYRGYKIEGAPEGAPNGRSWVLHVQPIRPELPILSISSFRVMQSTWPQAVSQAVARIDDILTLV